MKNEFDYLNGASVDLSRYETVNLSEKELEAMKNVIHPTPKKKIVRRAAGLAACAALIAVLAQTSFAKELIDNIIKSVSTGHNQFFQYDTEGMAVEIPKEYQIFYDEDGALVTEYKDGKVYYDKDGNKIEDTEAYLRDNVSYNAVVETDEKGVYVLNIGEEANPLDRMRRQGYTVIDSEDGLSALDEALEFKALMPGTLPEGFSLLGAAYFDTDGKYLFLYYGNGEKYITVSERLLTDETAFSMGTDEKIEETEVNGNKAVLTGDHSLDWEIGGVAVGVDSHGALTREQLFEIAESMK